MATSDLAAGIADRIADGIAAHLAALAARAPNRPPGSAANRAATDYAQGVLRAAGVPVSALPFRATFWLPGSAGLEIAGRRVPIEAPPYCRAASARGPVVAIAARDELTALEAEPGAVVVLSGELAAEPYFPKAFPFVSFPEQVAAIAALERLRPAAVLAVVADERAAEPVFEDPDLAFPYATVPASLAGDLRSGAEAALVVEATLDEGSGVNLSAGATSGRRAIVCAHIDSKITTPGLLDNGGGVATLLTIAEAGLDDLPPVELVLFNGEDHYAAPGEQAWLAARDLADVELVVNIDGAGMTGHRAAVSTLNAGADLEARVGALVAELLGLEPGPPWFESDHAVFAMRGIPTVAITSAGDLEALKRLAHDPHEPLDRVDPIVLAEVAWFVRALLARPVGDLRP